MIRLEVVDVVSSTQDVVMSRVLSGESLGFAVLARNQTAGRGRLQRAWFDEPDESLCLSIWDPLADGHSRPWLLGMHLAVLCAEVLDAQVQWPNDVVLAGRKLGGILAENSERGLVLGLGLNLNQLEFPDDIADRAISLRMERGQFFDSQEIAHLILEAWSKHKLPTTWPEIEKHWQKRDQTQGKRYRTPQGELVTASHIGPQGEMIDELGNAHWAADAWGF